MAKRKSLGNETEDSIQPTESRSVSAPQPVMSDFERKVSARLKAADESHGGIREDDGDEDGE